MEQKITHTSDSTNTSSGFGNGFNFSMPVVTKSTAPSEANDLPTPSFEFSSVADTTTITQDKEPSFASPFNFGSLVGTASNNAEIKVSLSKDSALM